MTPRERVLAAMRRTSMPDRCPFEISWGAFTPGLMKVYGERTGSTLDPCEYFDFDTRSVNLAPTHKKTDFRRFYPDPIPDPVVFDEWGVGMVAGPVEHFVEFKYHPLASCENPEEILKFEWPDVDAEYRFEPLAAKVADYQARGYAVTGELYQTIFEMAWLLRGMESLLMDFRSDPEIAHAICEHLTQLRQRQAVRYAKSGIDILRLGDDVGTQTGPMIGMDTYRTFLKERTRRIIAAAKNVNPGLLVFMHCDGQVASFIPEYLDIGVDILNPVQPECNDLFAIGRDYGGRLSFWGGIGTQSTMPFGSPEDVRRKVLEVRSALGGHGGLVLAPTHILEPEVPWENVEAFVDSAKTAHYSPAVASKEICRCSPSNRYSPCTGSADQITSRQRWLDTLKFKPVAKPWVRWGAFLWDETIERWKQEGWDATPLDDYFDLDRLLRVDPWYGPVPEFKRQVLMEDSETVTYVNHEGIVMREFKEHHDTSMPQFVKFPVETEAEFHQFAADRLALNPGQRLGPEWMKMVANGRIQAAVGRGETNGKIPVATTDNAASSVWPRKCWADRWGGFFGSLRNLMGVQNLCMAFYDQPRLIDAMMEERADRIIEITAEVLKHTRFEVFWFWEDMAYNGGPLVGPDLFRKFAFRHYRRVCDWLHSQGIEHIGLDSDGDINSLIPLWLDAGIDHLWPFEVQSGMDVIAVRKAYGRSLGIVGGIDKRALVHGNSEIRQEIDRVMPLVENGGFIPELDHSVPPNVSWRNFVEYITYLKYRLERG